MPDRSIPLDDDDRTPQPDTTGEDETGGGCSARRIQGRFRCLCDGSVHASPIRSIGSVWASLGNRSDGLTLVGRFPLVSALSTCTRNSIRIASATFAGSEPAAGTRSAASLPWTAGSFSRRTKRVRFARRRLRTVPPNSDGQPFPDARPSPPTSRMQAIGMNASRVYHRPPP